MTTRRIVLVSLLATALLSGAALAVAATGSGYTLDWFTVAGGGGTSGGSYVASGTIGQPDAGTLSGGGYTLNGGFWGGASAGASLYLPLVTR